MASAGKKKMNVRTVLPAVTTKLIVKLIKEKVVVVQANTIALAAKQERIVAKLEIATGAVRMDPYALKQLENVKMALNALMGLQIVAVKTKKYAVVQVQRVVCAAKKVIHVALLDKINGVVKMQQKNVERLKANVKTQINARMARWSAIALVKKPAAV